MDEKDFKKHLKDLAAGHHHPEEHDWDAAPASAKPAVKAKPAKRSAKSAKPRKRPGK
jgi:hypothetical protein